MDQIYALAASYLSQIGLGLFTIIGVFGNILVFYILTRPKFMKETIFRYFIASEIAGSLNLIFSWLLVFPYLLNWDAPVAYCKITNYLLYFTYSIYPWISVLNSIDRFLSLKYRSKFQFRRDTKYQILALTLVSLVFGFSNLPFIIFEGKTNDILCAITDNKVAFGIYLAKLLVSSIFPCFLMILSMCLSVHHLIVKKRKLYTNHNNHINYKRERNFLKSVLTMEIWFIVCYSPICVMTFLQYSTDLRIINLNLWLLLMNVCNILAIMQSCCSFFVLLYCNKQFRKYFHSMITSVRCKIVFN